MEAPQRAAIQGPAFIRLLARLADTDVSPPRPSLSDRLSQWIDWAHAVALASALDVRPPPFDEQAPVDDDADECVRARAALADVIARDRAFAAADDAPTDAGFYRQRHLMMQQVLEAEVGQLRARLRQRLSARGDELGRLASVDAAMERALGRHERTVLNHAPTLLAVHFERLRVAAADETSPGAWLEVFRNDLRSVLLAELDFRLQPAEGLLAALRTRQSD